MHKRIFFSLLAALLYAVVSPAHATEDACAEAVRALQPETVFGPAAACASSQPAFCTALRGLSPARFESVFMRFESAPDSHDARQMSAALQACGLDHADLLYRQCQSAFRQQEIGFVLRHCPSEAWSLARAQCERNLDSISPRYYELCAHFGRPAPR
jgi:hypothetical protein